MAVAAAAIAVLLLAFSLMGGRSDRKTAEQFFNAVLELDVDTFMKLIPDDVLDVLGYDKGEMVEELKALTSYFGNAREALNYVEITSKAVSAVDVDEHQLNNIKEEYSSIGVKVSAARTVSLEVRIQMEALNIDERETMEIPVIKVGRSWYIDLSNL